jgi:sulfane dehydrogenase subunit SoxC
LCRTYSEISDMSDLPTNDRISRRALVSAAGAAAGGVLLAGVLPDLVRAQAKQTAVAVPGAPVLPEDASTVPGMPSEALAARSPFEHPALAPTGVTTGSTSTPLQSLTGTITPSDLVFQRHHNGIALIDPAKHTLTIHGLVDRPREFTVADLQRFPAVTRVYFLECSGNGRGAFRSPKPDMTPQVIDGLTSNCEWTGVPLKTLLNEVGAQSSAKWMLAEGGDASKLSRSIPMEKAMDDALIVWAQNGEPLRPANGYPIRLLVPGYEGNMNIKWLRRIELGRAPWMFRDETSKYTDPLPNDTTRMFSFVLDAKSIITSPSYPMKVAQRGWWPIRGIAWTGRGKISRVDVSTDGGKRWTQSAIIGEVLPRAHSRFELMWKWDGAPARLMSRAIDETGYAQPTLAEFVKARGSGTDYHFNYIRAWDVASDGTVTFAGAA